MLAMELRTIQSTRASNNSLSTDYSRIGLSPFIKWAGGKSSLIDHLLPFVPLRLSNYYEPFLGGGALFLAICGRSTKFNAFLSDTNRDLINAFMIVKTRPFDLIRRLARLRSEHKATRSKEDYYYDRRGWKPRTLLDLAARFIFLNKTCYNGLYRVNPRGVFNVPFGHHKNPRIFDEENINRISRALKDTHTRLNAVDYKKSTAKCGPGDLVYLDPPYHPSSRTASFTDYTPNGFVQEDQEELVEVFSQLVDRGCLVLQSNSDTHLIRDLYRGHRVQSLLVNRPINCIGTERRGFKELIILGIPTRNRSRHRLKHYSQTILS